MKQLSFSFIARVLRIKPIGLILPQSPNDINSTNKQCQIFLTDALDLLESRGYCLDAAVFVIASLQEVAP